MDGIKVVTSRQVPSWSSSRSIDSVVEGISRYLESTPYGEEDPSCHELWFSDDQQRHQRKVLSSSSSWNVLLRLWLLLQKPSEQKVPRATSDNDRDNNDDIFAGVNLLPRVLVAAKAESLFVRATTFGNDNNDRADDDDDGHDDDLMDVGTMTADITNSVMTTTTNCWMQDYMLKHWVEHQRQDLLRDVKKDHFRRDLPHSEQRYLLEIIKTIDEVTGYKKENKSNSNSNSNQVTATTTTSPTDNHKKSRIEIADVSNQTNHEEQSNEPSSVLLQSSMSFLDWKQLIAIDTNNAKDFSSGVDATTATAITGQLDKVLFTALKEFGTPGTFDLHSEALRHLFVAFAIRLSTLPTTLEKSSSNSNELPGTKLTDTWTRCVFLAKAALLPIARSCSPPGKFLTWHGEVSSELESLPSSQETGKAAILWWKEVTLDIATDCEHRVDEIEIASGPSLGLHLLNIAVDIPVFPLATFSVSKISNINKVLLERKRPAPSYETQSTEVAETKADDDRLPGKTTPAPYLSPARARQRQDTSSIPRNNLPPPPSRPSLFPSAITTTTTISDSRSDIITSKDPPSTTNENNDFVNDGNDDDGDESEGSEDGGDEILLLDL